MKRSSYRSGNAAMQGFQLGQRLDGVRVADYARDLSPARGVRGLALSAGLGLGHGLGRLVAANVRGAAFGNFQRRPAANRSAIEANHEGAIGFGGDGHFASIPVQFIGHFVLRVGPIPTMCESSRVTSDTSTTAGRLVPPGRMTLPAYVLQLLTNATGSASALSGEQAGSTPLPAAAGPNVLEAPAAVSLTGKDDAMNAVAYRPEPSARADTDEMREAMFLASKLGIHYSEAVEHIRAKYAAEQGPCEVVNYNERRG